MNPQLAAQKALGRRMRVAGNRALKAGTPPVAAAAPGMEKPKKFHPLKVLGELNTDEVLTGKDLNRAARALTALEIRPQLHGYKQLANQLAKERNEEATGLGKLGSELQANVGSVYNNIGAANAQGTAAQQAIASMLNQQAGQIASQGQANLSQAQQGAVGDLNAGLALRGAPAGGSAQEALSAAVAQQQAAQNANSQASQQFAARQGAGNVALASQLGAATQMQGGAAVGGIGRDVVQRVGASNQKYAESIQQALGKLADVKATKGATMVKNLLGLREGEQKFKLGEQAVAGEKAKLGLEGEELEHQKEQDAIQNSINAKKANASLISALASRWSAHHPGASSNEAAKHKQEVRQEVREVNALIPGLISELGRPPKSPKELNFLIGKMNSKASADPALVQHVIYNWYKARAKAKIGSITR